MYNYKNLFSEPPALSNNESESTTLIEQEDKTANKDAQVEPIPRPHSAAMIQNGQMLDKFIKQTGLTKTIPAPSSVGGGSFNTLHYATATRRRQPSPVILALANQKLTHNSLVKTLQDRMHSTVPSSSQ